jgi:5-methylcytosine-specific restriction endonuclease McrA
MVTTTQGKWARNNKERKREIKLTPDHVIPVVHSGLNNIENIQPLCKSCNSRKSSKVIDFRVHEFDQNRCPVDKVYYSRSALKEY